MDDRTCDEEARFVETVTLEHVLGVIQSAEDPVMTVSEIADELGCTPEAATMKLKQLQEQGRVARRQVGATAVVWWLTEKPPLETEGEHDPEAPVFAAPPLDVENGEPIAVADTDENLDGCLTRSDDPGA